MRSVPDVSTVKDCQSRESVTKPVERCADESGYGVEALPPYAERPRPNAKNFTRSPPFSPRAQNVSLVDPCRSTPALGTSPQFNSGLAPFERNAPFRKNQPPQFAPFDLKAHLMQVRPE